jgi:hypothetical protein
MTLGTTTLGITTVDMANVIQHKGTLTDANTAYNAVTNDTRHIVTRQNDIWHYYTLNKDTRHIYTQHNDIRQNDTHHNYTRHYNVTNQHSA